MALTEIELPPPPPCPTAPYGAAGRMYFHPPILPDVYTSRRPMLILYIKKAKLFSRYFEKLLYFHSMIDYADIHRDGTAPDKG